MKLFRLFGLFSLFAILVISQAVLTVKAETLTRDFGTVNFNSSDYSGHNIFASMDVKANVQTESNGHWILNNTYQVDLLISIPYVNESVYSTNGFAVRCYQPDNPVYDATMNPDKYSIDIMVTPQQSGNISITVRPQHAGNTTLDGLDFALQVYYNNNIVTSGSWVWYMNFDNNNSNQPLSIIVDSNQNLPFSTPITPELTPVAVVIGLISASSLAIICLNKKKKTNLALFPR